MTQLIRVKKAVKGKLCLCLQEDSSGGKLIKCSNSKCTSPWWHTGCAGVASLNVKELANLKFTCALCLLSDKKFQGSFGVKGEKGEEVVKGEKVEGIKKVVLEIEKTQENIKLIQVNMKEQLEQIKKLADSQKLAREEEKDQIRVFQEEVAEKLTQITEENVEKKSYSQALMKNVEVKQEMISKMAREVVKEANSKSYDRSQREKNIIVFNMKESSEKDGDKHFIKKLFQHLKLEEESVAEFFRLGKKAEDKMRPLKMVFKDVEDKKKFLSSLHKLSKAPEDLKSIQVHHDLSISERDQLNVLLKKAKSLNEERNDDDDFVYKVRGPPQAFKIVKLQKAKN